MILALDIGNGSIKYARFAQGRRVDGGRLTLDTDFAAVRDSAEAAAVSVNPAVLARARAALPGLRVVGEEIPLPLPVLYDPPGDLGRDRVMAAVGALDRLPDAPGVLVLDAGTCLVATVAVRGVGVLGGAILPGPDLMARALAEGTAALPQVDPATPPPPLGRSTADSIRVGIDAAIVGAVRELVARFRAQADAALEVVAVGTGGGALAARIPGIAAHPFATLWGVYRAAM